MTKRSCSALLGTLAGALVAVLVIACASAPSKSAAPVSTRHAGEVTPSTQGAEPAGGGSPRGQIAALDNSITQDMAKLELQRPPAPDNACTDHCATQMATTAGATAAAPPNCKPGTSEKCGETCKLKDSICTAAGNICRIAADLGGNDSYANDACNRGNASCDAAKQRCCSCL